MKMLFAMKNGRHMIRMLWFSISCSRDVIRLEQNMNTRKAKSTKILEKLSSIRWGAMKLSMPISKSIVITKYNRIASMVSMKGMRSTNKSLKAL